MRSYLCAYCGHCWCTKTTPTRVAALFTKSYHCLIPEMPTYCAWHPPRQHRVAGLLRSSFDRRAFVLASGGTHALHPKGPHWEADFSATEVDLAAKALSATYVGIESLEQKLKYEKSGDEDGDAIENRVVQLSELASAVQDVTGALLAFSLDKLPLLGLDSCAALMQAIVTILPNNNELTKAFTDASVDHVRDLVEATYQGHLREWSPASSLPLRQHLSPHLERASGYSTNMGLFGNNRLDVELMQAKRQREQRAQHHSEGSEGAEEWRLSRPFRGGND